MIAIWLTPFALEVLPHEPSRWSTFALTLSSFRPLETLIRRISNSLSVMTCHAQPSGKYLFFNNDVVKFIVLKKMKPVFLRNLLSSSLAAEEWNSCSLGCKQKMKMRKEREQIPFVCLDPKVLQYAQLERNQGFWKERGRNSPNQAAEPNWQLGHTKRRS